MRELVEDQGKFIEIYMSTPLDICEQRDNKGLYAKARKGLIKNFTGVNDPYEKPKDAEIIIDSSEINPELLAQGVIDFLRQEGYLN